MKEFLNTIVDVFIDRKKGSRHPKFKDMIYPLNYGYITNTKGGDGEEIDVYIIDEQKPIDRCRAKIIAIVEREDDNEYKLVGVVNFNSDFSDSEIMSKIEFTEKWFKSKIIR